MPVFSTKTQAGGSSRPVRERPSKKETANGPRNSFGAGARKLRTRPVASLNRQLVKKREGIPGAAEKRMTRILGPGRALRHGEVGRLERPPSTCQDGRKKKANA